MSEKLYDQRCSDLAEVFLEDYVLDTAAREAQTARLAAEIQNFIELFTQFDDEFLGEVRRSVRELRAKSFKVVGAT